MCNINNLQIVTLLCACSHFTRCILYAMYSQHKKAHTRLNGGWLHIHSPLGDLAKD